MKKITILIPCYNEEASLHFLYERLKALMAELAGYKFEILFVNDGSRDRTLDIIKEYAAADNRISYIDLSRNFGKETAMIAGIDHVDSDALIIMDADLQDPPSLIPEMVKWWEKGYKDVCAKRRSRAGETWFKKWSSHAYYRILQRVSRIPIQADVGDFRLLDRECVDALKQIRESQRYTKGLFSWIGFDKKEILFDRDPRIAGRTKWNYGSLFNLAIEGLTSFTTAPLRIASFIGIGAALLAIIYMAAIIIKTIVEGEDVPGYPSLICVILFTSGVQLFFLGIIGEYLGQVFNETKRRPLYFIKTYKKGKANE